MPAARRQTEFFTLHRVKLGREPRSRQRNSNLAYDLPRASPRFTGMNTDGIPNPEKPAEQWITGKEPMTCPQVSYLQTLCREAGEEHENACRVIQGILASEIIKTLHRKHRNGWIRSAPSSEQPAEMADFARRRYRRTGSRLIPNSLAIHRWDHTRTARL
jgi:hypothetical protein